MVCFTEGEIPDANMIHLIRKKRQQARDYGDFIPLDDTERVENSKSRLVRSVTLGSCNANKHKDRCQPGLLVDLFSFNHLHHPDMKSDKNNKTTSLV